MMRSSSGEMTRPVSPDQTYNADYDYKKIFIEELRPKVIVLRLGHRAERDKRITTHVALVARAFGARGIIIVGDKDPMIRSSLEKVLNKWGGKEYFEFKEEDDYKKVLREWKKDEKRCVAHLTMYGIPVDRIISEIRERCEELIVIVGAEKVPREIFELADYNVSITLQPHSEVSALAVFLDRLYEGRELYLYFRDAELRIIPDHKRKIVLKEKNINI